MLLDSYFFSSYFKVRLLFYVVNFSAHFFRFVEHSKMKFALLDSIENFNSKFSENAGVFNFEHLN